VRPGGALDEARLGAALAQLALGVEALHARGVVHRDLKPSNVILLEGSTDEAPRLKLVDFGAACLANAATDEGDAIIGTPAYMSPEHARGEPTDGRTDLYALGVVLFEMLTGTVPFDGDDAQEILLKHLSHPAPVPRAPTGPLPTAVTRVVARALRKSADERYQNADEMLADIERAIAALTRRDWRRWLPT
jgi:serine/threonine-protein kinase